MPRNPLLDPLSAATRAIAQARRRVPVMFEDGEIGDLEREALLEGLPLWREQRAGFLYVASNASWPGLLKVGCTRRDVGTRTNELGGAGLPTPWLLTCSWAVYDAHGLEAKVKRACAAWHQTGEMFGASFEVLRDAIDAVLQADARLLDALGAQVSPGGLIGWPGTTTRRMH